MSKIDPNRNHALASMIAAKGMTQDQLATILGCTQREVSFAVNRKPVIFSVAEGICKELGINPDDSGIIVKGAKPERKSNTKPGTRVINTSIACPNCGHGMRISITAG